MSVIGPERCRLQAAFAGLRSCRLSCRSPIRSGRSTCRVVTNCWWTIAAHCSAKWTQSWLF